MTTSALGKEASILVLDNEIMGVYSLSTVGRFVGVVFDVVD